MTGKAFIIFPGFPGAVGTPRIPFPNQYKLNIIFVKKPRFNVHLIIKNYLLDV